MKIAFNAVNAKSFGITSYTVQLINHLLLQRGDLEITLFTSSEVADRFQKLDKRCKIRTINTGSTLIKTLYMNLVLPFKLFSFNVVHSVANLGMLVTPIPQVITIHDCYEVTSPERFSFPKRFYMRSVIWLSGLFAKRVITVSENTAKDVRQFYPHLKKRVVPIYSGCNVPVLPEQEVVREKDDYVLFVGTIEPGKNLVTLLKAIELLENECSLRLKVVGAKQWKQSEEITALFSDRVEFLEWVDDKGLINLYKHATVLAFPSLYEGFGFPVIEALANGCPVVAADNSAIPEAGGDAVLYCEALNASSLATLIMTVFNRTEKEKEQQIKKGLNQSRKFDWAQTAEKVFQVYAL